MKLAINEDPTLKKVYDFYWKQAKNEAEIEESTIDRLHRKFDKFFQPGSVVMPNKFDPSLSDDEVGPSETEFTDQEIW